MFLVEKEDSMISCDHSRDADCGRFPLQGQRHSELRESRAQLLGQEQAQGQEICCRWVLPPRSFLLLTPRCSSSKGSWQQLS